MTWRTILTDSESESGVAPVCPAPDVHVMMFGGPPCDPFVYDECCVGPHLETWSEINAKIVCAFLNVRDVEVCP